MLPSGVPLRVLRILAVPMLARSTLVWAAADDWKQCCAFLPFTIAAAAAADPHALLPVIFLGRMSYRRRMYISGPRIVALT